MPTPFRAQLPVRSPLHLGDLRGAVSLASREATPLIRLAAHLRERFAADTAILTASGTHALTLALVLAARKLGEERPHVLLPAWTCYDVATAAVGADVRVSFYDLDPYTLTPDLESLEAGLKGGARVVVVNPLYGFPLPWDVLTPLVGASGAILVEDAAQGAHGRWQGRWSGSFGDLSILSFGRGKGWTGAGGGALLLRREFAGEAAEAPLIPGAGGLSTLGKAAAIGVLGVPSLYGIPRRLPFLGLGETHYRAPVPPGAMGRMEAALVLQTADRAEREAVDRRHRAAELHRFLGEVSPRVRVHTVVAGGEGGFLRLPVMVTRDDQPGERLRVRLGIAGGYPRPLSRLQVLHPSLVGPPTPMPGAEELSAALLTLPTHSGVRDDELPALAAALGPGAGA